ncbi:Fungal specific transcription factor domain [Teratosphaeria destructans]|uniref:Fungal specific transcription factor domain n=1 Tax=Teratosphaeria destructans TaxID=418781 RepID=A0A9W7W2P8_9PEZI|nr:Fungal specific transcription factor domain [Teratosphaeria destructans]
MEEAEGTPASSHSGPQEIGTSPETVDRPFAPSEFLLHLPPSTTAALVEEAEPELGEATACDETNKSNGAVPAAKVDAQGRTLNPRSCVTCRRRKVRCDKAFPCNNCKRQHIECVFPAPGRAPRKTRKLTEGRDKELLERLRKLESVVKGMGAEVPGGEKLADQGANGQASEKAGSEDVGATAQASNSSEPSPGLDHRTLEQDSERKKQVMDDVQQGRFENRFGRLVVNEGRSRYVNNSFWASLSNEVEDLRGILNQSDDDDDADEYSPGSDPVQQNNHQGFVFGFSSTNVNMLHLHPMPNQIVDYWEVYKDRVDPLVKVLHIPTLEPTVLSASSHLSNLSKGFEALLFTLYYAAVTAMSPLDCLNKFGEDKAVLLSRYRFAVEQALARANFLTTEEAVVLQAFTIFLICLRRNSEARVIWTLTGLVVRIAQTMGIHRDGSNFGLAPFEVEMRRRLWWQVCVLDTRASEDHGCDPTIVEQSFDTKMPLNINDSDIMPGMTEYPKERQGCTDISFCLIRFEVANTFRRINYIPPGPSWTYVDYFATVTLQDQEKWITECHQKLEERYLKHCDMSVPLFWVTATVARLMMSKMWLMVYHPFQRQDGGSSLPRETKDKLFITSLENIEYSLLLETESRTMKWGWLFRTYMQWHALAFMLSELCNRTTGDLVERAWIAVEKTRDGRWGMSLTDDRAGHLWRPLNKLYKKAKDAYARGMQEDQLVKNIANGATLHGERPRYSPNANPMFGHPKRPIVTRAPLSVAQTQRFSEGPMYGQIPLDKHKLMKSPKISGAVGQHELDPMESAGLSMQQDLPRAKRQGSGNQHQRVGSVSGANMFAPTARPVNLQPTPGFGQTFMAGTNNIEFSLPPNTAGNRNASNDHFRIHSLDSNTGFNGIDPNMMDTSENLDWENWDQLVQQFGMDLDTTYDHRSPLPTAALEASTITNEWSGGAGAYGLQAGAAGAANARMGFGMGMGMGMNGSDGFW